MSINLLLQYPGKVGPITATWPYGEPRNITAPGDGLGTPWEAALAKDIIGLQQSLLTSAGIVPSGTPEQVGVSQYLQAISELASGRASRYIATGTGDVIILTKATNQESIQSYYTGLLIRFVATATNTGPATVNIGGIGVVDIVNDSNAALGAGDIETGQFYDLLYNGVSCILIKALNKTGGTILATSQHLNLKSRNNTFSDLRFTDSTDVVRAWIRHAIASGELSLDVRNSSGVIQGSMTLQQDGNLKVSATAPASDEDLCRKDYVDNANSGLVLLETQVISASTANIDFTTNIDNTYDQYILEFSNVIPVSAAVISARVFVGGVLQSAAADYKTLTSTNNLIQVAANVSPTIALAGLNGSIKLYNANNAAQYTILEKNTNFEGDGTGSVQKQEAAYSFQKIGVVDGIRIYGQTANIASGIFRLYGLNKT